MIVPTPLYTTFDNVKIRLVSKVQFQADPSVVEQGELPDQLLAQIIKRAETKVELDLRSRYAVPFRSKSIGTWQALPDHTKAAIAEAVDLKAVRMILEMDFGRGSHVNAEGYVEAVKEEYKDYVAMLLGRDQEGANDKRDRFRFSPPLDDLLLAATNREADDGYKGMIINTDMSRNDAVTYAEEQINDPSDSYIRRQPVGGVLS